MRVLLVSDTRDWHARRMEEAYAARGAAVERRDLSALGFSTASATGLDFALPDFAHVRTMAGGSFEAITRRLGVLHALAALGVRVVNAPRAIEACVDKSMTSFLIARAGLPTPPTWTVESAKAALALVRAQGPLVLKPLFGAQGKGLRLLERDGDLPEAAGGVYYLQRFEPSEGPGFQDFRLFVAGGRVAAGMVRRAATWITNVKQGGEPLPLQPDAELEALALAAARAVGAEIAGVDIIASRQGLRVLEVNSMPAWSGLQKVSEVDIAGAIADAVMGR